jgi:hypothetical protein
MKRFWTALAVAIVAVLAVAGCGNTGSTFQNNTGATITSLSPSSISAGSPEFVLTVNGGIFVAKTVVQWNGQTLESTLPTNSAGTILGNVITARVPASLVAKPGLAAVNTLSPFNGSGQNGLSNPIALIINPPPNPLPTLTSVNPNALVAGPTMAQAITLTGTNFLSSSDVTQVSQVNWSMGGTTTKLAVGNVSATQISATIPVSLLASPGTASVWVFNPGSPAPAGCTTGCTGGGGGGSSAQLTFTICATGPCTGAAAASATAAAMTVEEETPAVSLDGRFVAYTAVQNERAQVFLRDTCEGAPAGCQSHTTLLSAAADGAAANDESRSPSMSSDGRYVAFSSAATNLIENAPAGRQVYLRDTCAGAGDSCKPATTLISFDSNGALVGTESILPSVSSSGRFVAFLAITPGHASNQASTQTKASSGGTNSGYRQVFVRDTCLGAANCTPKTTRISLQPGDGAGTGAKLAGPAISGNANHIAIMGGSTATLFKRSIAVDDRVFLAITSNQN